MLPIKLFCVATIAFPFLVLSGYARLKLPHGNPDQVRGVIYAAILLVFASLCLQGAVFYDRLYNPEVQNHWSSPMSYSPLYMLLCIPCGMKAGRFRNRAGSDLKLSFITKHGGL